MEGMLIFAGLFSAALTAFLMESYKTLKPDPGDLTVLLLARISEQIVASAKGNVSNIPPPLELNDGGPTRAALACNALWFLSLGLSLSCALIATLLEQWAREFLHRTDIHSAPVIRARVFSFLYYGLRRFDMHAIVDIIPLLLHLSLLLFFSGLVAFLVPVNTGIALIAAVMLLVVATTYLVLTVFPLRYLDSPYRTPLTGVSWKLFQYFKIRFIYQPSPSGPDEAVHSEIAGETMVAAISRVAAKPSDERASRDLKALVWTVKSLADDTELEPFVEAISDMLWGPRGWRRAHYKVLHNLVNNPQTLLHARIVNLYNSCDTGILTPTALKRRKIICSKALWTTIPLLHAPDSYAIFPRESTRKISVQRSGETDLEVLQYASSVEAMVWWRMFENDKLVLNTHLASLQRLQATSGGVDTVTLILIQDSIEELVAHSSYYISTQDLNMDYGTSSNYDISILLANIRHILTTTPHLILFQYLRSASVLDALPYLFHWTIDFLRPSHHTPPIAAVRSNLDATFDEVVPRLLNNFDSAEPGWMDSVMRELVLSWNQQEHSSDGITLHPEFLRYLNNRRSEAAIVFAMHPTAHGKLFWEALANTLETTTNQSRLRDALTAAWRLVSARGSFFPGGFSPIPPLLDACMDLSTDITPPSLLAVLKSFYIQISSEHGSLCATNPAHAMHRWLATIAISSPDFDMSSSAVAGEFSTDHPLIVRDGDAFVVLYTEYLEICSTSSESLNFPYEAMKTLQLMDTSKIHSSQIHNTYQMRFADALRKFFASPACKHPSLRFTVIANTWLFEPYLQVDPGQHAIPKWLDNPAARDSVIATLTQYVEEMEGSAEADRD
ncbi:hypothetical protein R3P38DRAFT_2697118, partial [Favolaschia claudopus]